MNLKIQKLSEDATIPYRASKGAAGYDVTSISNCVIPPGGTAVIPTGLAMIVPEGTYGRIAPRSGLAATHSIGVGAGVIDADYRGPVGVVLFNHGSSEFTVEKGMRIAQLILERCETPSITVCDALDDTARGQGGFGSTSTM